MSSCKTKLQKTFQECSSNFSPVNKQIKIDSNLTPQTAYQRNLIWVKDTIFNPSAAPLLAQEITRLINQGYCLGQPNINSPGGILVGLYKQILSK